MIINTACDRQRQVEMKSIEESRQIFFNAIEDYLMYMKSDKYRKRMKKHPISSKGIIKRLRK